MCSRCALEARIVGQRDIAVNSHRRLCQHFFPRINVFSAASFFHSSGTGLQLLFCRRPGRTIRVYPLEATKTRQSQRESSICTETRAKRRARDGIRGRTRRVRAVQRVNAVCFDETKLALPIDAPIRVTTPGRRASRLHVTARRCGQ